MSYRLPVKKISISLAEDLLAQLDEVAMQEFASRSDMIRHALVEYFIGRGDMPHVRASKSQLAPYKAEPALSPEAIRQVLQEHPSASPNDMEYIKFMWEYEHGNKDDKAGIINS